MKIKTWTGKMKVVTRLTRSTYQLESNEETILTIGELEIELKKKS